jgi:hypothetical protein
VAVGGTVVGGGTVVVGVVAGRGMALAGDGMAEPGVVAGAAVFLSACLPSTFRLPSTTRHRPTTRHPTHMPLPAIERSEGSAHLRMDIAYCV